MDKFAGVIPTFSASSFEDMFIKQIEVAEKAQFAMVDFVSLMSKINSVKGKEQGKIERFLSKKSMKTKAFGMD